MSEITLKQARGDLVEKQGVEFLLTCKVTCDMCLKVAGNTDGLQRELYREMLKKSNIMKQGHLFSYLLVILDLH